MTPEHHVQSSFPFGSFSEHCRGLNGSMAVPSPAMTTGWLNGARLHVLYQSCVTASSQRAPAWSHGPMVMTDEVPPGE
jgi:hypothetical protein